jgi:hypothetical protein
MKKLIVNADDLGLTPGVSDGIIAAYTQGIVTSTSALMNTAHIHRDLPRSRQACPNLGIGVHLTLTEGQPLMPREKVRSLVDENGCFYKLNHNPEQIRGLDLDEVRAEWKTQIESFQGYGFDPDHLDSHHHSSYFQPELFKTMLELACEYQLPVRYPPQVFLEWLGKENVDRWLQEYCVKTPSDCITSFYGHDNAVSQENILNIIHSLDKGAHEMMCHPGYADQKLLENSSYGAPRELELEILTNNEIKNAIRDEDVQLISFSAL